jgi:hypothetical protein
MSAMDQTEVDELRNRIQAEWHYAIGPKVQNYVDEFFDRTRTGNKLTAKVEGNHGVYRVSIEANDHGIRSACSCYIGKDGGCHHCFALAHTFLNNPETFKARELPRKVATLEDVSGYLQGTTLDELLKDLKTAGINQKDFADSIGMTPRHLSSVKSSELRNRYYNELGATKLACMWMIEHFKRPRKTSRK